jgi:hypothetical protein
MSAVRADRQSDAAGISLLLPDRSLLDRQASIEKIARPASQRFGMTR